MALSKTHAVLKNIRLSFLHVFTPQETEDGEAKYSATILISKQDTETLTALNNAINAAKELGVGSKWGGKMPGAVAIGVYDGDGTRPNGEPFGEECKGKMVFTARANASRKPTIVDQVHKPIIDPTQLYSGCYANVLVQCYPYSAKGRKGVAYGLEMLMKVKDGEPLGASLPSVADVFGEPLQATTDNTGSFSNLF